MLTATTLLLATLPMAEAVDTTTPLAGVHNIDTGLNYASIQQALDALETLDGHTIRVDAGTYYERVTVRKSVTIVGEDAVTTIIDASTLGASIDIFAAHVNVTGFTLRGGSYSVGIWASNVNVFANIIVAFYYGVFAGSTYNSAYNAYNSTISQNIIGPTQRGDIVVNEALNETITRNIVASSFSGISLGGSNLLHNKITDNTVSDCPYGISVYGGRVQYNTISGNTVSNSVWAIPFQGDPISFNDISGNNISDASDIAIRFLDHVSYNNISGNLITNSRNGVYFNNPYYNTIADNTIIDDRGPSGEIEYASYGVHFEVGGTHNVIAGNRLENTENAVRLDGADMNFVAGNSVSSNVNGIFVGTDSSGNTVRSNVVHNNTMGVLMMNHGDNNTVLENTIQNNIYGIFSYSSYNNVVYHNSFIDNTWQAFLIDTQYSAWDNGYPSGGNFWNNYHGIDAMKGPDQDQPGKDGICDTPYIINADNKDRYPLMKPWTRTVSATVVANPDSVNLKSNSRWLTVYVELPEGYLASEIDISSIRLNDTLYPDPEAHATIGDHNGDGVVDLMVKFNMMQVKALFSSAGQYDLEITGTVVRDNTTISFLGSDTIRVFIPPPGDVNQDGVVDIIDAGMAFYAYGSHVGDQKYIAAADFNENGTVDLIDCSIVAFHYGRQA